ncbi:MAG: fructose-bisphosphatase class II [Caldilineaceae bacterium]|nr:fructose-bisphosphatase class II [Caldilineaceae bacterium]MBP8121269.1 fructose-bisphosphatase class II [Caldilineaceae bacterium]MBP9070835.1 fructose-bisphosphatase class II [Caldilineaceae bacterium]
MNEHLLRNYTLDLVRATEQTALAAGRWAGLGNRQDADRVATEVMYEWLNHISMDGTIAVSERPRLGRETILAAGRTVGDGTGPVMDVVVDAVDGVGLLVEGQPGAISAVCMLPAGHLWKPTQATYMEKIVVNRTVGAALVPECLDAPAAWTLALIARVVGKPVRDLVVFVLDRPRHHSLIDDIRRAGARAQIHHDGDVAGALLAASPQSKVDVLMGVGGFSEGVLAACAVRAMGGAMLGRMAPVDEAEKSELKSLGFDPNQILTEREIVSTDQIYFAATGVTDGMLLDGVSFQGNWAQTHSMVIRGESGIRRMIYTEHLLDEVAADERQW